MESFAIYQATIFVQKLMSLAIVYVLPNFEKSNGTIAEIKKAKELGIPVVYSDKELFAIQTALLFLPKKENKGAE